MKATSRIDVVGLGLTTFLVLVCVFMLAPLVFVVVNSFNSAAFSTFPPEGFSLRWYQTALSTPQFHKGLRNSLVVASLSTTLALVLGTLASRALMSHRFFGREALRGFFLSPLIVPRIVLGCALFLLFIRVRISGTLSGMVLGHALIGLPYVVTLITASMLNVAPETEEAAADLGANGLQILLLVTLPQIRVGLVVASVFTFITSFDEVEITLFLTRPKINTLPVEMLLYAEQFQDPTLAAVSTLLIGFAFVLALIGVLILRTGEYRRLLERG